MIYILIPVFNEEENILNLYTELSLRKSNELFFYVFSDDGSTDKTIDKINLHFERTNYTIIGDGINRGPGYAFNNGFEWILNKSENPNDLVITLESDCTSDLNILNDMIAINYLGYDLVLASVYAQGGGFDKTKLFRKIISSIANLIFRFLFNVKVQTISSFYRVYSLGLLQKIKLNNGKLIEENGFICMLEILIKAIKSDAKIIEVPMTLKSDKRKGKSKMKVIKTSLEYFRFLIKSYSLRS